MTTNKVIKEIDKLLGQHNGSESELLEALCNKADEWYARLEELELEDKELGKDYREVIIIEKSDNES